MRVLPERARAEPGVGRSRTPGHVVSDISNPFFPEPVKSIETAAFEHGYDVVLSNTNYEPGRTPQYVRRFVERKAPASS